MVQILYYYKSRMFRILIQFRKIKIGKLLGKEIDFNLINLMIKEIIIWYINIKKRTLN
jgi:hypothetical protein